MVDIFLSYGSEDRDRARGIASAFADRGWSVWWDRELVPGANFRQAIEKELASAKCVVVLWSKTSIRKSFVIEEANEGNKRGILLPALIDELVDQPLGFRSIHAARLWDWNPGLQHAAFELLVTAIGALAGSPATQTASPRQLVVLVHGIRTRAKWMSAVRPVLEAHGFVVEPTSYGRFDLLRFLIPVPVLKRAAIDSVWRDIQSAIDLHPGLPVSFIAHSFGTFVVANILKKEFRFRAHRMIFCGSVVRPEYEFEHLKDRFNPPVLNEVGSKDYWPAVAESITWGYGSTGTHGFNRPYVRDRYHADADHSHFLTASFAENWPTYLRTGVPEAGTSDADPASCPWWIDLFGVLKLKYVLLVAAGLVILFAWCLPSAVSFQIPQVGFLKEPLHQIEHDVNSADCFRPCQWIGCMQCDRTINISADAFDTVVCLDATQAVNYRDPFDGARALAALAPNCLSTRVVEPSGLAVFVPPGSAKVVMAQSGASRRVCNANPTCVAAVERSLR